MSQCQAANADPVLSEEGAIVGVDFAKTVFQLCIADSRWRAVDAKRLSRPQFEQFFVNRNVALVVMEACGTARHWARHLQSLGIQVRLIPAQYVRAYVRRNKTDAADAAALLESARCAEIRPVRVKSIEQQALQTVHRTRAIWVATRTARIDALRGFCREFGIAFAQGAKRGIDQIAKAVLRMSAVAQTAGRPLDRMRSWALSLQQRSNHNKAACALANKLARICYATLRDGSPYTGANAAPEASVA